MTIQIQKNRYFSNKIINLNKYYNLINSKIVHSNKLLMIVIHPKSNKLYFKIIKKIQKNKNKIIIH